MAALGQMRLGPQVISLYAVTSLVAVLSTTDLPVGTRVITAAIVTAVALAAAIVLGPLSIGPVRVLIAAALVGLVRGITLVTVLASLGGDRSPDGLRVVNSTLSAVIWIGAISLVLASREQYRARYAVAVRQVAESRAVEALDHLPEVMHLKTAAGSAAIRSSAEPSQEALRDAARVLRAEIEDRVRPLSHRIWFSARSLEPHIRIAPLVRDAAIAFSVPIWAVVALWTVSSLIGAPVLYGARQGIPSALVCAGLLAAMLLSARALMRRWPRRGLGPVLLILCATIPVAGTLTLSMLLGSDVALDAVVSTSVLVPLAIGALLLVAASITLANADRAQILRIADARVAAGGPTSTPEISAFLHNSLQSELVGLAMQLDRAEPGTVEAQTAVERLAALASRSIADDFRAQRVTPLVRLTEGAAAWRGIADVTVAVDEHLDLGDRRLPLVVQAIEELTSNAIRHGGARCVRASVRQDGLLLVVEVASDARRVASAEPASHAPASGGIGLSWLAAVSAEPLSVQPSADGTLVTVRI